MAANITLLTKGSTGADQSYYDTASVSPSANKIVLVMCEAQYGNPAKEIQSASGCGLTWTRIAGYFWGSSNAHYTAIFRAASGSSPSSGAIRITSAGTQSRFNWQVIEISGLIMTGTNGADAIVQVGNANGSGTHTSRSVTLSAFAKALNVPLGFYAADAAYTINPGSGFSTIATETTVDTTYSELGAANDNTVDVSFSSINDEDTICGLELNVLPPAGNRGYVIG